MRLVRLMLCTEGAIIQAVIFPPARDRSCTCLHHDCVYQGVSRRALVLVCTHKFVRILDSHSVLGVDRETIPLQAQTIGDSSCSSLRKFSWLGVIVLCRVSKLRLYQADLALLSSVYI